MIRVLVWLAGVSFFAYAIDRFGYWREFAALACLIAAMLWTFGGAFLISRGLPGVRAPRGRTAAETTAFKAAVEAAERAHAEREGLK